MAKVQGMRVAVVMGMFVALAGVIGPVQADDENEPRESEVPECVRYWGEARYGAYGYNHVVHVANDCDRTVDCRVSTNVSPDWQRVKVPAGETKEVVTYIASPSREFTPYVRCTLAK
ncbi:MAG: hypothetical protein ACODAU_12355 [Myxococcota bacterium]